LILFSIAILIGLSAQLPDSSFCNEQPMRGTCRAGIQRYYYNANTRNCEMFMYGGCDGNSNNFDSLAECERVCKPNRKRGCTLADLLTLSSHC